MTPRIWALELDKKESGGSHLARAGVSRAGEVAFFATPLSWLIPPRIWALELDKKKSGSGQKPVLT